MRTFSIEGDHRAPSIYIDEAKSLVEITGNSVLSETQWFYGNVLKWLIAFNLGGSRTQTINIRLEKVNESSSKWIALILSKLSGIISKNNFEINWYLTSNVNKPAHSAKLISDLPGFRVNELV